MFECTVVERDAKGVPTGRTHTATFDNSDSLAAWYDRQRLHNIEWELEQARKNRPIIQHRD